MTNHFSRLFPIPPQRRRGTIILSGDIDEAITKIKIGDISQEKYVHEYIIPRQTLVIKSKKKIDNVSENRLGPIPVLGEATDKDFVQWSLAMHKKGLPVGRYMII